MFPARIAACALLTLCATQMATAAETEDGAHWRIGVSGGTLGISPEIGFRFNRFLGVRANGGYFNYDRSEDLDDVNYDGTLKLNSVGVLADLHPFGGSFRISVGARSNGNKVDLVGVLNENTEIGDQEFTPAEVGTLRGTADFKKMSPTATIGWGGNFANGFTMGLEAGVMLQGSPKLSLTSDGTRANEQVFIDQLEIERAQAEEDASDFKLWPILQLHFAYRF